MLLIPTLCILAQAAFIPQTSRALSDTGGSRRDSLPTARDEVPARVAIDLGAGLGASFVARSVELSVNSIQTATKAVASPVTAVQLRLLRAPDTLSSQLAARIGSTDRLPAVEANLSGRSATSGMTLRLHDVQVVSMRLVTNENDVALMQQRLGLEESIAQLTIDLQEAQRQLSVTESLDKRKLSSSLEVAHAHATADALTQRLAVQREHLALVEQQLARWVPIEEEVVLSASHFEVETR